MLNQKLQLKLLQKLSPQQIQLIKLLEVPTIALEQRIKQEIEENPALEEGKDEEEEENNDEQDGEIIEERDGEDENEDEPQRSDDDEFAFVDYIDDDDEIPLYRLTTNNTSADDEKKETPFASGITFHEQLLSQLGLRILVEREFQIAAHIIGNLDDSGYLKRDIDSMVDDLAFSLNITTTPEELLHLLGYIQELDPPGVGARNLQECLLLQLKRIDSETENVKTAIKIIEVCFDDFTKKHYEKIESKINISKQQLKDAIDEILKLNPKPGNTYIENYKAQQYVMPDYIISNDAGKLELYLNSKNAPDLRISKSYQEMLDSYSKNKKNTGQKDALLFVKQKIDSAKWFIDSLKQRQNTLYQTMLAIMEYQKDYFLQGDETLIKPMILKDIAEKVNLDISTISRVANSKYVQTPFGTFPLKSFFSESMSTDSGEEVSTREVKRFLQDCVSSEDKKNPITDDVLTKMLNDKGYNIARRTIAKYREQLNIPVARMRKEI